MPPVAVLLHASPQPPCTPRPQAFDVPHVNHDPATDEEQSSALFGARQRGARALPHGQRAAGVFTESSSKD